MRRIFALIACIVLPLGCNLEGERLPVGPLPQDGSPVPYAQVLTRLSAQTNTAKEEYFLNNWDEVINTAAALEQSVKYLPRCTDSPPNHKAVIEKATGELNSNITKLREAARRKDQAETLELLRRLHNEIRDLQDLK